MIKKIILICLISFLWTGLSMAALEDFTGYTEVDENGNITVTSTKIAVAAMQEDDTSYVYKDFSAAHFGNFEHHIKIENFAGTDEASEIGFCVVSNTLDNFRDIWDADGEAIGCKCKAKSASEIQISILDCEGSGSDSWTSTGDKEGYPFWIKLTRSGTTLTAVIYSDAIDGTVVDTLVTTAPNGRTYRYAMPMAAYGTTTHTSTIDIEEYDINEAVAGNIKKISGVAWASVKKVAGVAVASIKKISGVTGQ